MRKSFLSPGILLLAAAGLFFNSCQKEISKDNSNKSINEIAAKVNLWLDKHKTAYTGDQSIAIGLLKENLNLSDIHLEKYVQEDQLIILPVRNGFKSANNKDKDPANYLVLILTKQGNITKGNIVQYIPVTGQSKSVPHNTFSKIFTYQDLDCSGQFTILSITDYFQYELKFENGKLNSITDQKKKTHPSDGSGRLATECIDWYLQTWYVWSDGTVELISEVYVYTTCDGDCSQPRVANGGRSFGTSCNGGGGGGNIDYEYEEVRLKGADYDWDVQWIPQESGGGLVTESHHLVGKFYSRHPENNHFVGGGSSHVNLLANDWGQNGTVSFSNTSSTVTINSNTQITISSSGRITFPNTLHFDYSGSKVVLFSQCYWY